MRRIIAISLVSSLFAAAATFAGWEYTAATKAEGGQRSDVMSSSVRGLADGLKSRVEFSQSGNPMMPAGSYLVSRDGGKTIFLVNPKEKKYATWDLDSMMGLAGGAMQMMGMKFSTPKVEKLVDEKGPAILGFPTRHYRFRTSYTMEMSFMGVRNSTETLQEEDIWATTELKDEGLGVWLNQKNMKTGNAELDKLLEAEMNKVQGFPLKRVASTTTKQSDGKTETVRMTSEITAIKKTDVASTMFEVPAGYQEQPMFPMGDMMGGGGAGKKSAPEGGSDGDNPFLKMMQQMQKGNR